MAGSAPEGRIHGKNAVKESPKNDRNQDPARGTIGTEGNVAGVAAGNPGLMTMPHRLHGDLGTGIPRADQENAAGVELAGTEIDRRVELDD